MNRYIVVFLLGFWHLTAFAQTMQSGFVKEYNEELAKTPLENVELVVTNAGTAVSDSDGGFSLVFRTLKPGSHVSVRRIEKLDYEVFNKDAVEQWNINPDHPFTIVMCRSDRFKKIRDNYNKVSSESYARQLAADEAALAELLDQGKLLREEYEDSLKRLRLEYDEQLETIDVYVDRFARIDLSELSEEEFGIIRLVQEGRIEEAIQAYENMDLVGKYSREVDDLREIEKSVERLEKLRAEKNNVRNSILESVMRQVNAYYLIGGRESHKKIEYLMEELIRIDPTDVNVLLFYADYLTTQRKFVSSLEYYLMCRDHEFETTVRKGTYLFNVGSVYLEIGDYDKGEEYLVESLNFFEPNSSTYLEASNNLAYIYMSRGRYQESEEVLDRIRGEVEARNEPDPYFNTVFYFTSAHCYFNQHNYEKAREMAEKAVDNALLEIAEEDAVRLYVGSSIILGAIYNGMGEYEKAEAIMSDAASRFNSLYYLRNPSVALIDNNALLSNLGAVYFNMSEYEKAKDTFLKQLAAFNSYESMGVQMLDNAAFHEALCCNNLGYLHYVTGDYTESVDYYLRALHVYEALFEKYPDVYRIEVARTSTNISGSLLAIGHLDEAMSFADKAIDHYEIEYQGNPEGCREAFALALKYKADALVVKDDTSALNVYDRAALIAPDASILCSKADVMDAKGCAYVKFGKKKLAKKAYKVVIGLSPEFYLTHDTILKDLFSE